MLLSEIKILREYVEFPEPVIGFINEHCQPYLEAVDHDMTKLMYRGVSRNLISRTKAIPGVPNSSIIPGHYPERIPRDTHYEAHKMLNDMFLEHYGLPFRNGLFVTGNYHEAALYGEAVAIFPIGNFKFCWSPYVTDLTDHAPSNALLNIDHDKYNEKFDRLVEKYQTYNLTKAIDSENEIMLYCDKCLMYIPDWK